MPPKKLDSHRGGKGQTSNRAGKGQTSSREGAKKKGVSKKAKGGLEPVQEADAALEPIEDLKQPLEAIMARLRTQIDEAEARLREVGPPPEEGGAKTAVSAEVAAAGAADAAQAKQAKQLSRVWKSYAAQQLSEMASSLDAILVDDSKLRQLFMKIDSDLGGSIDKDELNLALIAAGKEIPTKTLDAMFSLADDDGNGDIDYSEFADVIKGVKAAKAAFVIERGVRRRQSRKQGEMVPMPARRKRLGKRELERAISHALQNKTPKQLLQEWDQKKKGSLTRLEFRLGAKNGFGLDFETPDLDELFSRFDKNANGEIDLGELKDGFKGLKEQFAGERAEVAALSARIGSLTAKIDALEAEIKSTAAALHASADADAAMRDFRAPPYTDAVIGRHLLGRIKSADNPKAVLSFQDVVGMWDVSRKTEGFMDKEELAKLVAKEFGDKKGPSADELDTMFNVMDSAGAGRIEIRTAMQAMIDAETGRVARDATLAESAASLRAMALERQEAIKLVVPAFLATEAQEEAAAASCTAAAPSAAALDVSDAAGAAATPAAVAPPGAAATATASEAAPAKEAGEAGASADPLLQKLAALDGTAS